MRYRSSLRIGERMDFALCLPRRNVKLLWSDGKRIYELDDRARSDLSRAFGRFPVRSVFPSLFGKTKVTQSIRFLRTVRRRPLNGKSNCIELVSPGGEAFGMV